MRRAAKRDMSEADIVAALEAMGAYVWRLDRPVDLLVGIKNRTHLVEIKTGNRKLNKNQTEFMAGWRGSPVAVLRTVDDAIEWVRSHA